MGELPGDGSLLCTAMMDVPWRGTAPWASSLDCFLLVVCLLMLVIAIILIYLAWCNWVWEDPLCLSPGLTAFWEIALSTGQLSMKMNLKMNLNELMMN